MPGGTVIESRRVEIRVLGTVEVRIDGAPVRVPGVRARALLAALALSVGRPVTAEVLYDRVWGPEPGGYVRANLYAYVRKLRVLLGSDMIGSNGGRYFLRIAPENIDAVAFSNRVKDSTVPGADKGSILKDALGLWAGVPFGGPLSPWLDQTAAARLTDEWLGAVRELAEVELDAGEFATVVTLLRPVVDQFPLEESLLVRLLQALDGAGRQAEALELYERHRVWLADYLGVDPNQELRAMHTGLLCGEPLTAARSSGAPIKPQQLPAMMRTLGRESEMTELDALLRLGAGSAALGVMHGLGGVGKTTLAVRWAHSVVDRFPDGQLFINLRGFGPSDPIPASAALEMLLGGIGVPPERMPAGLDARSALWRSVTAGKRLLVVLDNARDAGQVRPLLPGQGCLTLITSRSRMRGLQARDGAAQILVEALSIDASVDLLADRGGQTDAGMLRELAVLCDRLPLALAVVAERIGTHPAAVSELLGDLRDERARLETLASPEDPLSDVRTVLSWSYDALDADVARVFRLLARLPGVDFGGEIVAALAGVGAPDARRLLARLVEANLVQGAERFDLHDLVRAYAAERTEIEDAEDTVALALGRLDRWCVNTARAALIALKTLGAGLVGLEPVAGDPAPLTFEDSDEADRWLDAEGRFLEAYATTRRFAAPRLTVALAQMLGNAWRERPRAAFAAAYDLAVEAAELSEDPGLIARAVHERSIQLTFSGDQDAAWRDAARALEVAQQHPGSFPLRIALYGASVVCRNADRLEEAAKYGQRALACAAAEHQGSKVAIIHNELALVHLGLGEVDEALRHAQAAVDVVRAEGRVDGALISALDTLGEVHHARGEFMAAVGDFDEVLEVAGNTSPRVRALVLHHRGRAYAANGERERAKVDLREAVALIDKTELPEDVELSRAAILADLHAFETCRG